MSQPSDEAQPLNEQELAVEIHRYFDLKLDREAYIKPSRDIVIEIYTRFLDGTGNDWRRQDGPGMLGWLRHIFSRYSLDFNMGDICTPSRKRTTTFLNVLIYIRALTDKLREDIQHCEAQQATEKDVVDKLKEDIREVEEKSDKLAEQKGTLLEEKSIDQRKASIQSLFKTLDIMDVERKRLDQKRLDLKKDIKQEEEENVKKKMELQGIKSKMDSLNQDKDMMRNGEDMIQRLKQAERELEQINLRNKLDLTRAQAELDHKVDAREAYIRDTKERLKKPETEIANILEESSKLADRLKMSKEQFANCIKQQNSKFEAFKNLYEIGVQEAKKFEMILPDYKTKRATLLGQPTKKIPTADVNITFIKSSNNAH